MERHCNKCDCIKPLNDFYESRSTQKTNKYGRMTICKACCAKIYRGKKAIYTPAPISVIEGEIWSPIAQYENLYHVSNFGRVRSIDKMVRTRAGGEKMVAGVLRKADVGKRGYCRVELSKGSKKKKFLIHRLVAAAFIENKLSKPEVNHKDGNKLNNRVENLEWATRSENALHSYHVIGNIPNRRANKRVSIIYNGEQMSFDTIRKAAKELRKSPHDLRAAAVSGNEYCGVKINYI